MLNPISSPARGTLCALLLVCVLATAPAAGAESGADAAPAAARVAAPPVVVFVVGNDAARDLAAACADTWRLHGERLAAELLPAGTRADTVRCLLLDTAAFAANFAGRLPDWGVAVALPPGRVVALDVQRLPAVGRGVPEVFLHEMVHALLFQGSRGAWLPTWLQEGAAMLYSGEWRFSDTVSLALAGRVPELGRLQGRFPVPAVMADQAYRTSLLAVDRLRDRYGATVIRDLVERTALSGDFATAFQEVTGSSLTGFADDFDGAMRLRFGWLVLLTSWPGLFVLLAVILILGAGRKLILARRRLARMEAEDDPWPGPRP